MGLSTRKGKSPVPRRVSTHRRGQLTAGVNLPQGPTYRRVSTGPERDPHRKGRLRGGSRQLREVLPVAPEEQRNAETHREDQPLAEAHGESVLHSFGVVGELRLGAPVLRNQHAEALGAEPVAYEQLGDDIG